MFRLCRMSKDLYNRCNFLMRRAWFCYEPLPDINTLIGEVKGLDCFKNLHNTKTAKQTVRKLLSDWGNFKRALSAFKKNPSGFIRKPKPPNYKDKLAQVIFYRETVKGGQSGKLLDRLTTTNDLVSIPWDGKPFKQLVITPKRFGFVIEIQYEIKQEQKKKRDKSKVATVDLGLNNLCAITLGQNRPILVNGRIVKSINQWYNKNLCKRRSGKRYWRLENYFHHVSKMIVQLCLDYDIGKIVIGKNDGWKQGINIGKQNNQAFCFVPMESLLWKIQYKAVMEGIEVVYTEEANTSKASFYDNDPLPRHGESENIEFSGKRKKRGLYVSKDGFAVNADVNGSMNIGRKVIPEFLGIRDRSLAARPVTVNPLKNPLVKNGWLTVQT